MKGFAVSSRKKIEAIDLTERIRQAVSDSGIKDGVCFVYLPHCTCALLVNEFEPNIARDYEELAALLNKMPWKHDSIDDNAGAHLAGAFIGNSAFLFVREGRLVLGTWQSIILLELDGPRERRVLVDFHSQ